DIGLVLVICRHNLDWLSQNGSTELLNGHFRSRDSTHAGNVGIDTAHILNESDTDDLVTDPIFGEGIGCRDYSRQEERTTCQLLESINAHTVPPILFWLLIGNTHRN